MKYALTILTILISSSLFSQIDPQEFAPNHPNVAISPLQQLTHFPAPRFHPNHTLMPLYNWMGMRHLGGFTQQGIDQVEAVKNSVELQKELAGNWHYMISLQAIKDAEYEAGLDNDSTGFLGAWIRLANEHPEWPLSATTLWGQVRHPVESGFSYIWRQNLPDAYYLRNGKGDFLNRQGNIASQKYISLVAPDSLILKDGASTKRYLSRILDRLSRPITMINENGEVRPLPISENILNHDPFVQEAKKKSGTENWSDFQASRKTHIRRTYQQPFRDSLPQLKNTHFSWYAVDGGPENLDRFKWAETRHIQSPINGQYYSTPDFYPRWPYNWPKWKGAWRGWDWIRKTRQIEIKAGDRLFSPFIGAGWDKDPEKNIRPSQWLGLLKHLGVVGAEFYYVGFFNTGGKNTVYPNPKNYVWQAALPAYAQAITSRYEDILRSGNVLMNQKGIPLTVHKDPRDSRILLNVRKHDSLPHYIISGNVNPMSNTKGEVPDELTTAIDLQGTSVKIKVRRQGSVYRYELDDPEKPVFYQLDSWHETGHPWHWSKDIAMEAEVYDEAKSMSRKTERANSEEGDFTHFKTYLKPTEKKAEVSYSFIPKGNEAVNYSIQLTGRSQHFKPQKIKVYLGNELLGKICIAGNEWKDYSMDCKGKSLGFRSNSNAPQMLRLVFGSTDLELDKLVLIKK